MKTITLLNRNSFFYEKSYYDYMKLFLRLMGNIFFQWIVSCGFTFLWNTVFWKFSWVDGFSYWHSEKKRVCFLVPFSLSYSNRDKCSCLSRLNINREIKLLKRVIKNSKSKKRIKNEQETKSDGSFIWSL